MDNMKVKHPKLKALVISLAVSLGTGGLAALLTSDGMREFDSLVKPPLTPPGWLFPIVWTVLFILMGVGAYLVYTAGDERPRPLRSLPSKKKDALAVYAAQLAFNFLWTALFFGIEARTAAFACLILLWLGIIWMIVLFRRVSPAAAYMQLPYLAWVTFAGYLNLMIIRLNPQ